MEITRRDIGYTVCSRLEEAMRFWIQDKLLILYGSEWKSHIPLGISRKIKDKLSFINYEEIDEPIIFLEETDLPDLMEIAYYKKSKDQSFFISPELMNEKDFRHIIDKLYPLRIKIAHAKQTFSSLDLDLLIEIARNLLPLLNPFTKQLKDTLDCIKNNPEKVVIRIPSDFLIFDDSSTFNYINNLPPADYESDGGFIGRKDDLVKIEKLVFSDLYRVITITGAGGVGKTALAQRFSQIILSRKTMPFSSIIRVSAKEEKLVLTGIEPIEPTFRTYDEFLNTILETYGWIDEIEEDINKKEENVQIILRAGDKGVLIVVDNLETIRDERIIEFIKTLPPPSKTLITSRLGLGEIERRFDLKGLNSKDAIILMRTIAKEKGVESLIRLPDSTLTKYADKMFSFPLAIKWCIGQIALGTDIDKALKDLTHSEGDIAKFCFEYIFDSLIDDNCRIVLYALASYDKPLVKGVLSHITDLKSEKLERTLRQLTLASLIIPKQLQGTDATIETRYELLPLTTNYIQSKLIAKPEIHRSITSRIEAVEHLIEDADRAGKQYRYSLRDLGAETEQEKVAATWAFTAHQKYQSGDYDGALQYFERASQIAPNFPAVYRNWAIMESDAGFFNRSEELMRKATALKPNDARLWFVWGNIEKRRNRYERAYSHLNKALDLSPNDPHIMGALAEVEKRRNNFDKADSLLRKALSSESVDSLQKRRHETICYTSLADNTKRWAETMAKSRFNEEEVLIKFREAYQFAEKAIELSSTDNQAQDTLREVALCLAIQLYRAKQYEEAHPYFEQAIIINPKRAKERKTNEIACYYFTLILIEKGELKQAKKYYSIGRKSIREGSKFKDRYKDLYAELNNKALEGTLINIVKDKGYGFLEIAGQPGQSAFLHISNVIPEITLDEFEELQGHRFTFLLEYTQPGKSPLAKRARIMK